MGDTERRKRMMGKLPKPSVDKGMLWCMPHALELAYFGKQKKIFRAEHVIDM
jgi:hypothetical protein